MNSARSQEAYLHDKLSLKWDEKYGSKMACITLCRALCPCTSICMNTYTHVPHTQYAHNMHKPDCQSLICSLNIYLYT